MNTERLSQYHRQEAPLILKPVLDIKVASSKTTRKFRSVQTEVNRIAEAQSATGIAQFVPELVFQEPAIDENTIKDLVVEADLHIAALKGYDPKLAAKFREIRQNLPNEMSLLEYLRHHVGKLPLSYANDITTTYLDSTGVPIVEHKVKDGSSKQVVFDHLLRTVGLKSSEDPFVSIQWRETLALHDAATDISVVRRNTHDLLLYRPNESFLNALIYGLFDADHTVDTQTAKRFIRLYEKGTEYSRPGHEDKPFRHLNNWAGWTPASGMPLENLLRVNGARPGDTLPFIELLVAQVDGLRPTQDGYDTVVSNAIKDVRGKARDFQYLLRRLEETIAAHTTLGALDSFQGDPTFVALSAQLSQLQADGKLVNSWHYSGRTKDVSGEKTDGDLAMLQEFATALLGLLPSAIVQ